MTVSWLRIIPRPLIGKFGVLLYSAHLCLKCSLGISNFLEEISSLSHSVLFLYFFALVAEEGFLISSCYSWKFAFRWEYLSFSPLLFTSLLSTAICKASSDSLFYAFIFHGDGLHPWSCTKSQTSIQSSSGTLSDLLPYIYFSLPLYNHKGFDWGHPEWSSGFPYFLQFKSEFGNKEFMIWAAVSSWSYFWWLYRVLESLAAKNIIWFQWWCLSLNYIWHTKNIGKGCKYWSHLNDIYCRYITYFTWGV